MAPEYDIFISHRTADDNLAVKLAKDLATIKINGPNIRVWIDNSNLEKTSSTVAQINSALEKSRFVLLLMTPSYFEEGSGWTEAEWMATIASDPMNRAHRIIPVLAENCPYIPALIGHLNYIDLRGKEYKSGVKEIGKLLSSVETLKSSIPKNKLAGVKIEGDNISEELRLNLLKVEALPKWIYVAPLLPLSNGKIPTKNEMVEMLIEDIGFAPAFRVLADHLISFHDPRSDQVGLDAFTKHSETIQYLTEDYIANEHKVVISLLNMELTKHFRPFYVFPDKEKRGRYHFAANPGPAERKISWFAGHRSTERTVVKALRAQDDTIESWLHQSAYVSFLMIDESFYLKLRPTWVLTTNGEEIKTGPLIGKLISKWTNAERNESVFYHLHFWAAYLARKQDTAKTFSIRCGSQKCIIRRNLCAVEIPSGISWDYQEPSDSLERAASEIEETFGILPGLDIE